MPFVLLAAAMFALFTTCRWGGRTLAEHYEDGWEVAAVAAIGVCAFAGLWVAQAVVAAENALPTLGLVAAGAGGLFAGYLRGERV